MQRKTFVLKRKKTYRRGVKAIIKDPITGKFESRTFPFTTEHIVTPDQRHKPKARLVAAEYSTDKEYEIDALLSCPSYGIDYFMKGDEKGELKRKTLNLKPEDYEKVALKNLFDMADIEFDDSKPLGLLKEEYRIHISSGGKVNQIKPSGPLEIPHVKVDPLKDMKEQMNNAISAYKEKYGEDMPEEYKSDKGFLSAILQDPKFDAQAYIEGAEEDVVDSEKEPGHIDAQEKELTKEELHIAYFKKTGKRVPNPKSNDLAWVKNQLEV